MGEARGYRPIGDYAALGDCHGGALVARDGGIDWACFGRFDADPVLCRVLDARRGGHFSVTPSVDFTVWRAYLPATNVLRTVFRTARGEVALTDFMALGRRPGAGPNDYVSLQAPGWLVRRIEGLEGEVALDIACRPTSGHGERFAELRPGGEGRFAAAEGLHLATDLPLAASDGGVAGTASVRAGDRRFVALGATPPPASAAEVDSCLRTTRAFWEEWVAFCRYAGDYRAAVERSALALKLMTYPASGACVAAFTTSLPECVGGERNWDYRFCWIRDASLMLHALAGIGYAGEGRSFMGFLCERLADGVAKLQVMYGLGGEARLTERIVAHLEGYRASAPVRTGNGAFSQDQIDLYGYALEGAWVFRELGGRLTRGDREALVRVVDFIEGCWTRPDTGLWEVRGEPRHFVHSKAMCWLALDRGIRLFGERGRWRALREEIRAAILREGCHPDGHLLQSYAAGNPSGSVDAALLQLPALGFPLDRETLHRTRVAVQRQLASGDLLLRYRTDDGVPGRDAAFLACSFWLVDALLAEGEEPAATALFERLLARANDVGLYSEELDPGTGEFLGNFPQAFTHFALVNSAVSLDLFGKGGARALEGGYAGRARRSIGASVGWRGVLAALRSTGRVRLRSSRASILRIS